MKGHNDNGHSEADSGRKRFATKARSGKGAVGKAAKSTTAPKPKRKRRQKG
jgi:hypothetical protein